MTSLAEAEIMTLKRLEVALKKNDYKLLKDGVYKLHEKFHGGHKFEYIDTLKDILYNANNSNAPSEIKYILISTIEDILSSNEDVNMSGENNRVSSLTSLGYKTQNQTTNEQLSLYQKNEDKLSVFDIFTPDTSKDKINTIPPSQGPETFQQQQLNYLNQFSQQAVQQDNFCNSETFEKYEIPKVDPISIDKAVNENVKEDFEFVDTINNSDEIFKNEETKKPFQTNLQTTQELSFKANTKENQEQIQCLQTNDAENKIKTLSILYFQQNSDDKNKNIKKYRDIISEITNERNDFSEIINLISSVNTQSNSNISELTSIFEQIQNKDLKINLITNSTNSHLVALAENLNLSYKFNSTDEKVNLLPLFGLTNMFKCTQCQEEYLDTKDDITPYIIQCPKCKSPMMPNFYSINTKINLDIYNNAIVNLANSDMWLVLYPSAAEKAMFDILKSALKLNKNIENIFICDKDINARENYKNAFVKIKENLKVNIDLNALEEFFKSV